MSDLSFDTDQWVRELILEFLSESDPRVERIDVLTANGIAPNPNTQHAPTPPPKPGPSRQSAKDAKRKRTVDSKLDEKLLSNEHEIKNLKVYPPCFAFADAMTHTQQRQLQELEIKKLKVHIHYHRLLTLPTFTWISQDQIAELQSRNEDAPPPPAKRIKRETGRVKREEGMRVKEENVIDLT